MGDSGHVPVLPSIRNKNVNSKRDMETWSGRNCSPTKDKAFIFKVKRGFDEPIDKRRLSVVSLPVWLAYVTSFSIPIRIQVHTSVAVVPTHASLRICFFQV